MNTNIAGGRGRGHNAGQGRHTYIDEIIARADSSTRPLWNSTRRGNSVPPNLEHSASTVENTARPSTPVAESKPPEDKGSVVGAPDREEIYHIDGTRVTKEVWLETHRITEE